MSHIIEAVTEADKDLFIKFRDGQMTLDQLGVRIAERKFRMDFKCLDDLKEQKSIEQQYYENIEKFMPFFEMIYGTKSTY